VIVGDGRLREVMMSGKITGSFLNNQEEKSKILAKARRSGI
jgi:hypothetical protein